MGDGAIPLAWLADLELRAEIEALAADLAVPRPADPDWRVRYPKE